MERFITRNWLVQAKSRQLAVFKLETQENPWCHFGRVPKTWEPRRLMVQISVQGQEKTHTPVCAGRQEAKGTNDSPLCLVVLFRPSKAWWCPSTLGRTPNQIPVSSENTFTQTLRNNVLCWHSVASTHKTNHQPEEDIRTCSVFLK